MKNKRRIIGIAAAVLLALVGTASLIGYVNAAKADAVAEEELVDVYVIDEFVPKGADAETIKSAVELEQVPARLEQDGAIHDLDDLGDDVAASDLQPGDQLLAARLASRGGVIGEVDDKVQVSARLDAEQAVGGALQKGDLVGVYLSFEPFDRIGTVEISEVVEDSEDGGADEVTDSDEATGDDADRVVQEKTPNMTSLEFHHVLVTNVQTVNPPVRTDDDSDDATIAQVTGTQYVVTLALSPEESERFVFATEFGSVWLSIEPASVTDDGTRIVTLGDVYKVVN
jgi:pilus assembly protein CpaB